MPDKYFPLLMPILFTCLLSLFLPGAVASAADKPEQQIIQIQTVYRNLTSLSFDFSQLTSTGGRERKGAGNAVFYRPENRPGIMRWNYIEPDPQVILNDGTQLSIYTAKDNQLIVTPADELQSDITYGFFSGTRTLLVDFTVKPADNHFLSGTDNNEMQVVQLVPRKPHGQLKTLHLWFDKDFLIRKISMEDHFGSITELQFTHIKLNALPVDSADTLAGLLRLDLPPGTEIINQ